MRNITIKTLCLVLLAFFINNDFLSAQAVGKPNGAFFSTSSPNTGGQLAHRKLGTFGSFAANARWISLGQPAGVSTEIYGMRIQDRGNQATFSLNGNGVKDLEIQWGSNGNSTLNFNFATSNFTKTPVMKLDPFGRVDAFNRIRANSSNTNTAEYTEIGHGGASGYINTVGDGFLDFRHDGTTKMRLTDGGRLAINRSSASFNLDVNGNARNSTGMWTSSDRRYKKDIQNLSEMTEKLLQLEGVSYQFKREKIGSVDLTYADDKTHFGFIAQDLAQLFPELVMQDEEGYYAVRYDGLVPVLVEGFKDQNELITEQQTTIVQLNKKVDQLEQQMAEITAALKQIQGTTVVSPSASLSVQATNNGLLKQNRPNPFNGLTTIDYNLPETMNQATLVIHNIDGRQITSYALTNRQGSIEFDATNLGAGTYVYTLLANGEKIAQRKMVVK